MNEYSQKIYDLLIEKAKEIIAQGFFEKEDHGIPEIVLNYAEIPSECWEKDNVLESIQNIKLVSSDGKDFDAINVITSVSVSNKLKLIKVSLSYHIWEQLLKK